MGRFFSALVKTLLILVLVLAAGWYALGEGGPFEEKGQQLFGAFQEQNSDLEQSVQDSSDEDTVLTVEEAGIDPTSAVEPSPAPEDLTTKIVFTGDVELSEYVQSNYSSAGVDGVVAPEIKDLMTNATFTMINNEFCFSERGQKAPDKQYTFRVNPSYVSLLNDLGVDIAGLANNHVLDFGRDALTDTFTTLTNAGIDYTGAGNSLDDASKLIVKTDAKGRTYGFLAASHVIPVGSWNVLNAQPGEFCFYDETDLLNAI